MSDTVREFLVIELRIVMHSDETEATDAKNGGDNP